MSSRLYTAGALLLAAVLLFAVNVLAAHLVTNVRLDLTKGRLYTLSDGTRSILAELRDPITLRLFLSGKRATRLPGVGSYAVRVRELLAEYARASNGQIVVQLIDPAPFSEAEDRAVAYGLRGIPLDGDGDTFYFGLVGTNSFDNEFAIPFMSLEREELLEYDLSRMVYQLAHPDLPVIGLISGLPLDGGGPEAAMMGRPAAAWVIYEQLGQVFDMRSLGLELEAIPAEVSVLLIAHPKGLSEQALFAIDQFVLGGGRALVFLDPFAEADQSPAMGMPAGGSRSDIGPLLASWGLEMDEGVVAADIRFAPRVRTERDGRLITVDYPVWLNLPREQLDAEDIVTADLDNLVIATAGILRKIESATTEVLPLIQTSSDAMRVSTESLGLGADPRQLLRDYSPGGEALMLAARVSGHARTAFPDGRPVAEEPESEAVSEGVEPDEVLLEAVDGINVIVVADSDLLDDRFWVQTQNLLGSQIVIPTAANGSFVINAAENLAGGGDLISVRGRAGYTRPFHRVDEIRRSAEQRFRQKEQELNDRLQETERRLLELEQGKVGGDALSLSEEQQDAIVGFREEKVRIRGDLREVRRELREDIDRLESWIKFINIGLIPMLIAGVGIVFLVRGSRRQRARRPASA